MKQEDLAEVVRLHGMWLRGEIGGVRANLSEANLREAGLCGADLSGANLSVANLAGANLREAMDGAVARLDFGGWSVCVRAEHMSIGCQQHANAKWLAWTPESPEIAAMHADAADWWRVHGEAVKAVIRCVMAKAESGKGG